MGVGWNAQSPSNLFIMPQSSLYLHLPEYNSLRNTISSCTHITVVKESSAKHIENYSKNSFSPVVFFIEDWKGENAWMSPRSEARLWSNSNGLALLAGFKISWPFFCSYCHLLFSFFYLSFIPFSELLITVYSIGTDWDPLLILSGWIITNKSWPIKFS